MGHIRDSFHIDAPLDVCWDVGTDAGRQPEWSEGVLEVKDVTGRLDQVGAGYTGVFQIAGRHLEARFEVVRVEPLHFMEVAGTTPGGGTARYSVRNEAAGSGTDGTFEMDYELPGGLIGDLANKLFMERALERQMRHSNENLNHPVAPKGPQTLPIECWSPPSNEREPNHTHPEQESRFEVLSGELAFRVAGREFRAGPGETVTVPPAVNHRFWNPTDTDAHYVQVFDPALDTRRFFEVLFRLVNEGKLGKGGMPKPLHLPVLFRAFGREIRPWSPPWPVTRLAIAALAPVAALRGYHDPADL